MNRVAVVALLVAIGASPGTGSARNQSQPAASSAVYLLRLERAGYLQSVCVLLDANGGYHLERHTLDKVRVFEGSVDAAELREIVRVLSADQLFRLEQKQIPDLMLKSDNDRVLLEVHRPAYWQQLLFPDSASRVPFRDEMEPLLKWLDAVNKRKTRQLSEEAGRNNCLPPARPEFAQRSTAAPERKSAAVPPPATVTTPSTYILRMIDERRTHYQAEASCLLVSTSGMYHVVRQWRSQSKGLSTMVLDGTLDPAKLASLRGILDAPELVNQPEEKEETEVILVDDSFFTRFFIPRGSSVQKVAAWNSYRIANEIMTRSAEDHGTKVLTPLSDWLTGNIDERAAVPTAAPANPRCSPDG